MKVRTLKEELSIVKRLLAYYDMNESKMANSKVSYYICHAFWKYTSDMGMTNSIVALKLFPILYRFIKLHSSNKDIHTGIEVMDNPSYIDITSLEYTTASFKQQTIYEIDYRVKLLENIKKLIEERLA